MISVMIRIVIAIVISVQIRSAAVHLAVRVAIRFLAVHQWHIATVQTVHDRAVQRAMLGRVQLGILRLLIGLMRRLQLMLVHQMMRRAQHVTRVV